MNWHGLTFKQTLSKLLNPWLGGGVDLEGPLQWGVTGFNILPLLKNYSAIFYLTSPWIFWKRSSPDAGSLLICRCYLVVYLSSEPNRKWGWIVSWMSVWRAEWLWVWKPTDAINIPYFTLDRVICGKLIHNLWICFWTTATNKRKISSLVECMHIYSMVHALSKQSLIFLITKQQNNKHNNNNAVGRDLRGL